MQVSVQLNQCQQCAHRAINQRKQRKSNCEFVADYSTRRGHMERFHREAYLAWCKANTFLSMLPKDSKARREGQKGGKQTSLNENWEGQQRDVVIPYTHQTFIDVAREWLISTDQPLSAMDHPKFREMIHTAARAKNGVKIPRHQDVRKGILEAFRRQMREMKKRLSVRGNWRVQD
ncbi:hypothetical protein SISNIDRAFT_420588 [Sistotremastrum niveocremeum HHB9708]|uniref:Uncharacterized protein n=1 Tax=Sistotremastrum niveocremeum HHB9708 TaxID=1314777 RepID=A0A164MI91_9AGAM|nr:hypothetical protein SISNIDRAFT_420588 [Sistotremastrum niveocremeum HHB9708]